MTFPRFKKLRLCFSSKLLIITNQYQSTLIVTMQLYILNCSNQEIKLHVQRSLAFQFRPNGSTKQERQPVAVDEEPLAKVKRQH